MPDPLDRQLLSQARRLARLDPNRPQQGNLHRAVSSAYYGLFHFLIDHATRQIIGVDHQRRPYRDALARGFDHGVMLRACKSFAGTTLPAGISKSLPATLVVPLEVRHLAQTFIEAQGKRHLADYDRTEIFTRADVLATIHGIEQAIAAFRTVKTQLPVQFFLACLSTWDKLSKRE